MQSLGEFWRRLMFFWRGDRFDRDLEEEMRFHQELRAQERVEVSVPLEEARYAAQRQFGNVLLLQEESREMWEFRWLETLFQDIRYGLRQMRRNPGFTAVAVITLALGIGANTAIFSVVNGILLQPLEFSQPGHLVSTTDYFPQGALVAMRSKMRSMEVAGYWDGQELNMTGMGEPIRLQGTAVSANFFSVLGVRPELGRAFLPGEDQPAKDDVVMLSHALWLHKFGGDPNVIGHQVTLEGENREVVGVMPAGFRFGSSKAQFWIPLHLDPRAVGAYWGGGFMPVLGRLRTGVTLAQARAELRAYIPRVRKMFPWRMPDALWAPTTVVPLQQNLVGGVTDKLLLLLGATGLILLIACVNVANLLLARAATRRREMAMRSALGAGRWRICRQLLTESLTLAMGGGALGVLFAVAGLSGLKAILPADTPRLGTVAIDWRVLAFAAAIAILTGLVFGISPALHASRIEVKSRLTTGGRHLVAMTRRLRDLLTLGEVALAFILVTAAGLTAKSLWELLHVNPGFQTEFILAARLTPNESYCADFARCRDFYRNVLEQAQALPGIEGAAAVNVLPLGGRINAFSADLEGHPRLPSQPAPGIFDTLITPDYLRVMRIPLLRGRAFTPADMASNAPPVALITRGTANKFWPGQDPIGKHIKRVYRSQWVTVVGVVGDVNEYTLASRLPVYAAGAVYEPYGGGIGSAAQRPAEMTVVLRTKGNPQGVAQELRKIVTSLNPDVPVTEVRTLRRVVAESAAGSRSTAVLFAVLAVLALALGTVGVYGVISYSVVERTQEIGVRMALGAQKRKILEMLVVQGAKLTIAGVAIGIASALLLTRLLSSLLYGTKPTDPLTFVIVALVLSGAAMLACYIPARRATKVDPIVALRYE
jgi:predicted permease